MQKTPFVFPIIGGRKVEHLHANLEALELALSPEQIKKLDSIVPFEKGYPFNFVSRSVCFICLCVLMQLCAQGDGSDYNRLYKSAGHFDKWPTAQAIRPAKQ